MTEKFSYVNVHGDVHPIGSQNRIIIDWFRISFDAHSWRFACALFDIDYTVENWSDTLKYRKNFLTMPFDGVTVAAESLPYTNDNGEFSIDGRFIVDFSGNGLGVYFQHYPHLKIGELIALCSQEVGAAVLRLEVAFDDFGRSLNIFKMAGYIQELPDDSRVITRWRGWRLLSSGEMFSGDMQGVTLYLGSRTSGAFARVYDKRMEVLAKARKKGKSVDLSSLPPSWVRFELELKGKKAQAVVMGFQSSPLGFSPQYFTGLLRGLIEFKEGRRNGKKKSELKAARWWTKFVGLRELFPVSAPLPRQSIESKIDWVNKSVAPTLALLQHHYEGDLQFIYDLLSQGEKRLTVQHRSMLSTVEHGV